MSKGQPYWPPAARFWVGGTNGGIYNGNISGLWPQNKAPYYWGNRGAISGLAVRSGMAVAVDTRGLLLTATEQGWSETNAGFVQPLRGVACGRDQFVAVGDAGTVIASTTGTNWTKLESGTASNLWGIAFLNDQFVAVGEKTVITSPDGLSWAAHSADANLRGVTFKHGLYAAVELEGKILTSTNAVEWTSQPSGTTNDLYAISSDAHQFVAVGNNATILTGRDGTNWTAAHLAPEGSPARCGLWRWHLRGRRRPLDRARVRPNPSGTLSGGFHQWRPVAALDRGCESGQSGDPGLA